jgi:hypothetical protein
VPVGPKGTGRRSNVDGGGTVNVANPESPKLPVTVTVYGPLETPATVKDPDIEPPATWHTGLEMRPPGDDEMPHPTSPSGGVTMKPEPVIRT